MLTNHTFVTTELEVIKIDKFITKKQVCLLSKMPFEFNGT